jgi:hypothetical protein
VSVPLSDGLALSLRAPSVLAGGALVEVIGAWRVWSGGLGGDCGGDD